MRGFEYNINGPIADRAERIDEKTAGLRERMIGVQSYVKETLANGKVVDSLVGQDMPNTVGSDEEVARMFAHRNQFLIPQDVKELGEEYEAAYILSLAEALRAKIH